MTRKIYTFLLIGLCLGFAACNDKKENIDPNAATPVVNFPINPLAVDLNKVDNLPVVAVIKSQAGLKSVAMRIKTSEGEIDYKVVTEFFNEKSYSLSERMEYEPNYKAFIIEATDKLNHTVRDTLHMNITGVMQRPGIIFDPSEIIYDEMDENPTIPRTTFKVTSEAGLKRIEMFLVSATGQVPKGTIDFNGEKEYAYDEMINYVEGDRGFKVKAEDSYGYITISTLPVTYRTTPKPELNLDTTPIVADEQTPKGVPMKITSVRGVREVVIYRVEGDREVEALREQKSGETSIDYAPEIMFTDATSKLKVVVSDGRAGKEAIGYVKAYVNMGVANVNIGSQPIANKAHEKYPDAYGLVSLNDLTSYSVDYVIANDANAKNADFKFYAFGGSAVPRLYSMSNSEKDSEYAGSTGKLSNISVRNDTRLVKLSGFDFENATVSTIADKVSSSTITATVLNPVAVGDVIAFKTASTSAAGGDRVGVMKITNVTPAKELSPSNATICVMSVEIKFPKKK